MDGEIWNPFQRARKNDPVVFRVHWLLPLLFLFFLPKGVASPLSLLDPSFAVGTGADASVNALALQLDRRILVGGEFATINGQSNSYLTRLNSDGSVDGSFNLQGITDGGVNCMLSLPDGRVLVGGAFNTLLGISRHGLARLDKDGMVDPSFDARSLIGTNGAVYSLAIQDDGQILAGMSSDDFVTSRILRLGPDGARDDGFISTNEWMGFVFALLPLPDGRTLAGINPLTVGSNACLVLLNADGRLDANFNAGLGSNSSVFALVREPDGHILVGGRLARPGLARPAPLLRMSADLNWDDTFRPDAFAGAAGLDPVVNSLLVQPNGKIVVGGYFFEVAGYWRREIVRLSTEGHVDTCFDPGLGLGGATIAGPVRRLLLQADGRILIGGVFDGIEGVNGQLNLARLLPQSPCDSIRVFVGDPGTTPPAHHLFAAATFPPGGTNVLEASGILQDWRELARDTAPYIYVDSGAPIDQVPMQFFRARQEH